MLPSGDRGYSSDYRISSFIHSLHSFIPLGILHSTCSVYVRRRLTRKVETEEQAGCRAKR